MTTAATPPALLPDLISFDSWEDSGHLTALSVRSNSPTFADEHEQNEHESIHSFGDGDLLGPPEKATVSVTVSGSHFSVDQRIFHQLKKLPWQKTSDGYDLSASADLFEICLNFLLFKTLPDAKSLSSHDKEELEVMAVLLDLTELASHIMSRSSFRQRRRTSSMASYKSESSSKTKDSAASEKTSEKQKKSPKAADTIKPSASKDTDATEEGSTGSSEGQLSPTHETTTPSNAPNEGYPKAEGSPKQGKRGSLRKGLKRFSFQKRGSKTNKTGGSQRQLNHEEWCASHPDIIN